MGSLFLGFWSCRKPRFSGVGLLAFGASEEPGFCVRVFWFLVLKKTRVLGVALFGVFNALENPSFCAGYFGFWCSQKNLGFVSLFLDFCYCRKPGFSGVGLLAFGAVENPGFPGRLFGLLVL